MMIFKPAHKNMIDPPGQIVNPVEITLGQYIARKQKELPKKLTFEEWVKKVSLYYKLDTGREMGAWTLEEAFKRCWNAAQENK